MPSYRRLTVLFLAGPLAALALLALYNLATSERIRDGGMPWWQPEALFSADGLAGLASRVLVHAGISIDPGGAVIGRDGWLFLGDRFGRALSMVRYEATDREQAEAARIGQGAAAWRDWLAARGVSQFWVLVAPDKDDVYPDYLPAWVQRAANSAPDAIRAAIDPGIMIDGAASLREARALRPEPLFWAGDTHWNTLGAWYATDAFFRRAAAADPSLRFVHDIVVGEETIRPRSDMTGFLRTNGVWPDRDWPVRLSGIDISPGMQVDFDTGEVIEGAAGTELASLSHTPDALNQRRLLFLSDSFGGGMRAHLLRSFSDVLSSHVLRPAARTADLVTRFRPDIVLVTVVDRQAGIDLFRDGPPD